MIIFFIFRSFCGQESKANKRKSIKYVSLAVHGESEDSYFVSDSEEGSGFDNCSDDDDQVESGDGEMEECLFDIEEELSAKKGCNQLIVKFHGRNG